MSPTVEICGSDLLRGGHGPWVTIPNTKNGSTNEKGHTNHGGGVAVDSTVAVSGASDNDLAHSRYESSLILIARAPGPGPFDLTLSFGNVYARAEGRTRDEWGSSSHSIWWEASLRVSALFPQWTLLGEHLVTGFVNYDGGDKGAWIRHRPQSDQVKETKLGIRDWDHDECGSMFDVSHVFSPPNVNAGDILGLEFALRLNQSAWANDVTLRSRAQVLVNIAEVRIASRT